MSSRLIIYEDAGWQQLLPLVYVRAAFQLVCGSSDLLSRIARLAASGPTMDSQVSTAAAEVWCRPLLADVVALQTGLSANAAQQGPALFLNGRGLWNLLPG